MLTVSPFVATAWVVVNPEFTVRSNEAAALAPAPSVTVTVNVVVASDAVGVPLISPFAMLKLIPAGRVPPLRAKFRGAVPVPAAPTGVNGR